MPENRRFAPSEIRSSIENSAPNTSDETVELRHNERSRELVPANRQPLRQSANSFFAIFYERPVRRRYYRQFNRSATNLVRRLSQSRLFLNSSRAQNAAYRENYSRRNRQDTNREPESPVILDDADESTSLQMHDDLPRDSVRHIRGSVHSLDVACNDDSNRSSAARTFGSENDIFSSGDRSESPPPPYHIVASHIPK